MLRCGSHSCTRKPPYLSLPRKHSRDNATLSCNGRHLIAAYDSFIDGKRLKGWVGVVGWCIADGLKVWTLGIAPLTWVRLVTSSALQCSSFMCDLWCVQDLTGMWVRFEHDLYHEPFTSQDAAQSGSRVIACRTLTDWRYTVRCSPADNECSVDESMIISAAWLYSY